MAWRLHLSDWTIKRLDILAGSPNLLAAWTQANRVTFLELQNGTRHADYTIEPPPSEDRAAPAWTEFLQALHAPNGAALPFVRAPRTSVSQSEDAKSRLYQTSPTELFLELDGSEASLELDAGTELLSTAFDRTRGVLAALDASAELHLYRRHVRIGVFETGLQVDEEFRPALVISQDGSNIFLTDGHCIVLMDNTGTLVRRLDLHYRLGALACSPDGKRCAVSDLDANLIRVYDASLAQTHQRFAVDLLSEAKKSQLFASPGTSSAALGPLAISNKGALAFAMSGTVCVTSLARLKAQPKAT